MAGLGAFVLFASCADATGDIGSEDVLPSTATTAEERRGFGAKKEADLACDEAIEEDADVPKEYAVIVDAVALPTADSASRALQVDHQEKQPPPNYWAKAGLAIRAGTEFTISVDESPGKAQIGWGHTADSADAVTATGGCPGSGWMTFAGGFVVDEPRCVNLVVESEGEREAVQVGVGAPCKGQEPPPGP